MGLMGGIFAPDDYRKWPKIDRTDPAYRIDLNPPGQTAMRAGQPLGGAGDHKHLITKVRGPAVHSVEHQHSDHPMRDSSRGSAHRGICHGPIPNRPLAAANAARMNHGRRAG
jgi:hypothetical protein